jgi:hypothetical protein
MAKYIQWLIGAAAAMTAMAGCDPDTGETSDIDDIGDISDIGELDARGFQLNGFQLNGFRLNGFRLNGFRLNGSWLGVPEENAIKLVHAQFTNGPAIMKSWLVGSNLHVMTELGTTLSGPALGGVDLVFDMIKNGQYLAGKHAKILSVKQLAGDAEVWLYDVLVQDENNAWQPLCVDKNNVKTEAILLADVWDPASGQRVAPRPTGSITLACRGAALAKCVEWGYAPWRVKNGVSLADFHQTCTRAMRADYCGDGEPHTVDGVEIHVKDPVGVQKEDPGMPHVVEAEWGPEGALCLNYEHTRMANAYVDCALPACDATKIGTGKLQTGKLNKP